VQRAKAGILLAEASLFVERYHCDALAIEASRVLVISRKRVNDALASDPALASAWAKHLAHELQRTRAQAEILSLRTLIQRLDAWLALNDNALPPKGQWRQIASEIGVSPEALYRELARRRGRSPRAMQLPSGDLFNIAGRFVTAQNRVL
jgi:CRP-like cAMP-binding protein